MRPPEELGTVDWPSLHHAYGDADEVPDWIRALYGQDAERADQALDELFHRVLHQGSVYPATVAAVPFLAHAAVHAAHGRAETLTLLAGAGGHGPEPRPGDEREGCARVAAEVPGLLDLLRDDDPRVRRAAVRVTRRAAGETVPAALAALTAAYEHDPAVGVRAEALTVLTRLDPDPDTVHRRLRDALTDPADAVRATAALALLERTPVSCPADLVAILAEAGGDETFDVAPATFFPGVGDTDGRVADALAGDPDATIAVARAWIARGDLQGRGSRRAVELSDTWRDRENESLALLAAALPHERSTWELSQLLGAVLWLLPGATDPAPALGDALLPHARTAAYTTEAAQLALGRLGDERLLTAVPDPAPVALAALAARTGRPDHLRLALRHPTACRCELYAALGPDAARTLLPELTGLLRHHPTATLARRFGDWGVRDAGLLDLLGRVAQEHMGPVAAAAAVTAARLGADPEPALRLLRTAIGKSGWSLEEAGRLGPSAAPLLPAVEACLADEANEWNRLRAAEAHARITGDPTRASATLTALVAPDPVGIEALEALLRLGPPFPADPHPRLRHWATTERRQVRTYALPAPGSDPRPLDDRLREAARRMAA